MHIAVCIDDPANRKQMERLLKRASDARPVGKKFYIESFGSSTAFLHKIHLYDAFFIDMLNDHMSTIELVKKLLQNGVTCPVILCPSACDYQSQVSKDVFLSERTMQLLYLPQPVLTASLEEMLVYCENALNNRIPQIELRADKETFYITEEELISAVEEKDKLLITLTDKRKVSLSTCLENFMTEVAHFASFAWITPNVMVNQSYIAKINRFSITLTTDESYKISQYVRRQLLKARK